MAQDLMYPPRRKRPKGENSYARVPMQNTPRKPAQASMRTAHSAKQEGFSSTWLLLALAGGAALAWAKSKAGESAGSTPFPAPGSGSSGSTPPPKSSGSSSPTGAPMPPQRPLSLALVPNRYVFVQSWNGETVYERLRQDGGIPDGYGLPSTAIVKVENGELLGKLTGNTFQPKPNYPQMLEVYADFGSGKQFNYWVDASEVVVFSDTEAQAYINRGVGKLMGGASSLVIKDYYSKKYGK